jgi:hypothetical protein
VKSPAATARVLCLQISRPAIPSPFVAVPVSARPLHVPADLLVRPLVLVKLIVTLHSASYTMRMVQDPLALDAGSSIATFCLTPGSLCTCSRRKSPDRFRRSASASESLLTPQPPPSASTADSPVRPIHRDVVVSSSASSAPPRSRLCRNSSKSSPFKHFPAGADSQLAE